LSLPPFSETAADAWSRAGAFVSDLFTPTLRLGVTGLARSGKTVFITAMIRNLVSGGRLPFLDPYADGRILSCHLEPQPDDDVPRFDYEGHLAALSRDPPEWPESTRRISELRIAISFAPKSRLRRALGVRRLNVDIVDYPGEWLLDLAMLGETYAAWSAEALRLAREPQRHALAKDWLAFVAGLDPNAAEDEQTALEGARLFTHYLQAARTSGPMATVGPGRFLMPGDLEGSPLLTFFPLAADPSVPPPRGSLGAMMARRFDSYVAHVVRPFFRDHFARLDRQIVLVDVLGAFNGGSQALAEMERGLAAVLRAFKPGLSGWLGSLGGRRIDRLLFAATKADHIHHSSHDRLEALLRLLTERASARAEGAGAEVQVLALASLRATREAEARHGKDVLPCIVGVPLPGERVAGTTFDGRKEVALFPGDLPADPRAALDHAKVGPASLASFPRFRPPRLLEATPAGESRPAPHIRLDRALDFLIGDWLQ
jgi:predicted YcjX-like family ATPase